MDLVRIDGIEKGREEGNKKERIKWREGNEWERNEGRVTEKNREKTLKERKLHELIRTRE